MAPYKSRQKLTAGQRDGILFLIALLLLILYFRSDRPTSEPWKPMEKDEYIICQIAILDSLRAERIKARTPRIYPFNPTLLNDYRAYLLNLPAESVDRIAAFRNSGNWISSLDEFQRISGLEDSVMERIKPYLKLPVFKDKSYSSKSRSSRLNGELFDLNTADQELLMELRGIGEVLSRRIITLRGRLGGFAHIHELYAVYGLNQDLIELIKEHFVVETPRKVDRFSVNSVSASDIATIPGLNFEIAEQIWRERRRLGGFTSWSQVKAIPRMGEKEFALIEVYLTLE